MYFTDTEHDPDSSEDTWVNLYNKVYAGAFSSIFDFNDRSDAETSPDCKRWYIKINGDTLPERKAAFPKFKIAGDCDFNFNDKKVALFREILGEKDHPMLMKCHQLHHELCNFSFMPITGGMNNVKGRLRCRSGGTTEPKPLDRLDLFLSELDLYFQGRETRVISPYNQEALHWYLGNFQNSIYHYCAAVHLIDDEAFVNKMIASGKEPITTREKATEYMELALQYWKLKSLKLREFGIHIGGLDET